MTVFVGIWKTPQIVGQSNAEQGLVSYAERKTFWRVKSPFEITLHRREFTHIRCFRCQALWVQPGRRGWESRGREYPLAFSCHQLRENLAWCFPTQVSAIKMRIKTHDLEVMVFCNYVLMGIIKIQAILF